MLRLVKKRSELRVVSDHVGFPTYAIDVSAAIQKMLEVNTAGCIYHYLGDHSISWSEFTQAIFSEGKIAGILTK